MKVLEEFREFAISGNVLDLAVGVMVGAAFGKITTSLVEDVITPVVGLLLGKTDFTNLFISLDGQAYKTLEMAKAAGAPVIRYGVFLNNVLNFLIVAFVLFLVVKGANALRRAKKEEPVPVEVVNK